MLEEINLGDHKSVVDVDGVKVGGGELAVMAGPCAVEGREQLLEAAEEVKQHGGQILRGGAFKPRTSPHSFQGLQEKGLELLAEAREQTGLKVVTEVMDTEDLDLVDSYTDILQIGSRNMQNYGLLKKLGTVDTPVMLKRGYAATIKEWLLAAEYIISYGNPNVILCERGIRTFETATRYTLDLNAIALIKEKFELPIIVDPSHGTGRRSLVAPMAKAGISAGADGVMVEVHPQPEEALSDGKQSLTPEGFSGLMNDLVEVAPIVDRELAG